MNLTAVDDHPETMDQNFHRQLSGKRRWIRIGSIVVLTLSVMTLSAGATYAAIANKWATSVTGTFFGQTERDSAVDSAHELGVAEGHSDGLEEGHDIGYSEGEQTGYASGHQAGVLDGYADGSTYGFNQGYDSGYADGGSEAYLDGFDQGWHDGCIALFTGLGTDRVGDWWDYYYSSYYGSYFTKSACD
jgi:hypothetical protein